MITLKSVCEGLRRGRLCGHRPEPNTKRTCACAHAVRRATLPSALRATLWSSASGTSIEAKVPGDSTCPAVACRWVERCAALQPSAPRT
jgi:hypothetical protein